MGKLFLIKIEIVMKKKLSYLFLIVLGILLFIYISKPGNSFNIIPYVIYVFLVENAPASGGEKPFILIFDMLVSALIPYGLYKLFVEKK
jgi:hypothetical protein